MRKLCTGSLDNCHVSQLIDNKDTFGEENNQTQGDQVVAQRNQDIAKIGHSEGGRYGTYVKSFSSPLERRGFRRAHASESTDNLSSRLSIRYARGANSALKSDEEIGRSSPGSAW